MFFNFNQKIIAGVLGVVLLAGMTNLSFADDEGPTTEVIHLGFLQVGAHDFFDMNRDTETDNENGKLDLSTVLFNPQAGKCTFEKSLAQEDGCSMYDDDTIANGGEKRNVENIMISTASAETGEKYLQLAKDMGEEKAYQLTLEFYHGKLKEAYEESFNLKFPQPRDGAVTNLHNLALRSIHDFIPAELEFNGEQVSLFAIDPLGEKLSPEEQSQPSSTCDGLFDEEFLGIDFCPIPPFFCINVNLLEADQTFGEQFGLGANTFDEFMVELEDGAFSPSDEVSILIDEAFGIGLNLNRLQGSLNGDNQWDSRPTFGVSHEDSRTIMVGQGFTFNENAFSLTDSHHTPFEEQTIEIGEVNSFAATVYAPKNLKVQEFLFGVPDVGLGHLAEMRVEVWYDREGEIKNTFVIQDSEVIDRSSLIVTNQKSKCLASDAEEKCNTTIMSAVFLEPLEDNVMAVKAIDFALRDQTTYLNDGFVISGDSLNPMETKLIPSPIKGEGLIQITQNEKYSDYWSTDDGRIFEMNSFGSFKQINQSFERFEDGGNAFNRLHSDFGKIVDYEQNRAIQVFDSSNLMSELPASFSYNFSIEKRLNDKMIQEMKIQEHIAQKLLDEYKVQTHW